MKRRPANAANHVGTVSRFETRVEQWHIGPVFRTRVLEEWGKIEPNKAMGWIAEWPA
jgi:hypothetical protein